MDKGDSFPVHLTLSLPDSRTELIDEILKCDHSKRESNHFFVVLFVILYKVILTFEFVG